MSVRDDYEEVIREFIERMITVEEFQERYFNLFKDETRELSDVEFELLDTLFGDADAYTDDGDLLKENPAFYLDESALRERATRALSGLAELWKGVP